MGRSAGASSTSCGTGRLQSVEMKRLIVQLAANQVLATVIVGWWWWRGWL